MKNEVPIDFVQHLLEIDRKIFEFFWKLSTGLVSPDDLEVPDYIEQLCDWVLTEHLDEEPETIYDWGFADRVTRALEKDPSYRTIFRFLTPVGRFASRRELIRKLKRLHDAAHLVQAEIDLIRRPANLEHCNGHQSRER